MAVDRVKVLAAVPLFASLSKRQLRVLARAPVYEYAPEDRLVREGSPGETLFVILEGTARVSRGGRTVRRLGPGEFFGDVSVFDRRVRSATVSAQAPLRCIAIHRDELRSAVEADPKLAWHMLEVLAGRLRD